MVYKLLAKFTNQELIFRALRQDVMTRKSATMGSFNI